METNRIRTLGASIVVLASLAYGVIRLSVLGEFNSSINTIALILEFSTLALVSVEAILLATRTKAKPRKQDEKVLIESAKQVLYTKSTNENVDSIGDQDVLTKTQVYTHTEGNYASEPVDVLVFAEDASYEELRRCFLSLKLVRDVENIFVITPDTNQETIDLIKEFGFSVIKSTSDIQATTKNVMICRGKDIVYPDANEIAKTYDFDDSTFLELRSVFSDKNALGENGLVEINDKRQQIRESIATRSLSTWATGPAVVAWEKGQEVGSVNSAEEFFRGLERNSVHGSITQEIVSEEISNEPTIAEVNFRAIDFKYTARAMGNSYKAKGTRLIGIAIKAWSAMVSVSFVRRMGVIALALIFVLDPARFEFLTTQYLLAGIGVVSAVVFGSFLAGDRRSLVWRIRELYFDIEAVFYNVYSKALPVHSKGTDKSIVKKLPSVTMLLIMADLILIYRVVRQYNGATETLVSNLLKNASLFTGYLLVVSMLIGLGMVIVRQSRTALRREISRGANLNSEPVSMIDLSPGGAGCISVSTFEEGSEVQFESSFPIDGDNKKFSCQARVKSCVNWNDTHRIGLEFQDLTREQLDTLETYCSIVYPHTQARENLNEQNTSSVKSKINGRPEKRFISYAASFITLGAIIFSNITTWG